MDARVRTGASAPDQPASAPYCPPGGSASASASGKTSGATPGTAEATSGYSASMGDVGMSDAGSNGRHGHSPTEAFKDLGLRLAELKEFASYYVAAKADAWKIAFRNLGMYAALGIVGLIAGSAIISTAAVLLLVGIAWGLGDLLWDQYWLGALIVGLLVLGGLAGGTIFFMKSMSNTSRKRLLEKYQNRQRDQRIQFGEDVRGRRAGVTEEPARAER